MKVQKILCLIDLNDSYEKIVQMTIGLAKQFGSDIKFLYIAPQIEDRWLILAAKEKAEDFLSEMDGLSKSEMKKLLEKEDLVGIQTTGEVLHGNILEKALEIIEKDHIDFVVMGAHKASITSRFPFLGSTAIKILRSSPVPVMTIRPEAIN